MARIRLATVAGRKWLYRCRCRPCNLMKQKILLSLAVCGLAAIALFLPRKPVASDTSALAPSVVLPQANVKEVPAARPDYLTLAAKTNALFRTPEILWSEPVAEEAFARFKDWADRYLQATAAEKPALVA